MNCHKNKLLVVVALLAGCTMGQLERVDNSKLSAEKASEYASAAVAAPTVQPTGLSQPVYNRFDLGKMSLVNYGVVVESNIIDLTGTVDQGWRVGASVGAINAINVGATSTESWLVRMVGGALIGAAIESSLTSGQAYEYIIRRSDGQLISTLNRSKLSPGDCLLIRTDPSNSNTLLELKPKNICDN